MTCGACAIVAQRRPREHASRCLKMREKGRERSARGCRSARSGCGWRSHALCQSSTQPNPSRPRGRGIWSGRGGGMHVWAAALCRSPSRGCRRSVPRIHREMEMMVSQSFSRKHFALDNPEALAPTQGEIQSLHMRLGGESPLAGLRLRRWERYARIGRIWRKTLASTQGRSAAI